MKLNVPGAPTGPESDAIVHLPVDYMVVETEIHSCESVSVVTIVEADITKVET